MSGRARASWRFAAALAPALGVGVALRLWRLPAQVLGGDELHTLRVLFELPVSRLLVTYQLSDVCLPLAALFRALADAGVSLSEWHLRAPSVLAGGALLVYVPFALRPRIGARAALATGWLLALSPLLFFYSRIARSYGPLVLAVFAALLAFDRWWEGRRLRDGAAYVAGGALAIYLHPAGGPFVAAPFLYALIGVVRARGARRREGLRLVALLGSLVAAASLFLVPAAGSLERVVAFNLALRGVATPPHPRPALSLALAGTHSVALAVCFWALAARGLFALARRRERFALYSAVCVVGGLGGLAILSPLLPRYAIACLPFALAWVAVGLTAPLPRWPALPRPLVAAAALGFCAALVATGPFVRPGFWQSSFMHHNDYVDFTRERAPASASELPAIYRELEAPGPLVEYPWLGSWEASRAVLVYQEIHGRRVLVSSPLPWLNDARLSLKNVVRPTPAALLASDARYLVVHLDPDAEEDALTPSSTPRDPAIREHLARRRRRGAALAERLRRAWGAPDHATPTHLAWDLERLREQAR